MRTNKHLLLPILILTLLTSCSFLPANKGKEQTDALKNANKTAAEIVEPAPLINVGNNHTGNVTLTLPAGMKLPESRRTFALDLANEQISEYKSYTQMSMGFNLILLAIGFMMIKKAFKGSAAFKAISNGLDGSIASLTTRLTSSTDTKEQAGLFQSIAMLESQKKHLPH